MARSLILCILALAASGCAGSRDERRPAGTSPQRRDLHASRTHDEDRCMRSARVSAQEGSVCGQADISDRGLDAREARRCALIRCMQAKGYTAYGTDAPARDGW